MSIASAPVDSGREDARRADRLLAARCAAAPPARAAWEELYGAHSGAVRAWIRRGGRMGDDEGVDDMAQQVFVLCARGALARYRGDVSLRSYLLVIADRVRISENRRLTRQRRDVRASVSADRLVAGSDASDPIPTTLGSTLSADDSVAHALGLWRSDYGQSPEEAVGERQEGVRLQAMVSAIGDERDREIVTAYYWGEEPDRVIGERLGLATDTVTWRRHRALAGLKRNLQRQRLRTGEIR